MTTVRVKLLFFAQARVLAGKTHDFVEIANSIICGDLLSLLVDKYSLQTIKNIILVAVNEELLEIDAHLNLKEGDVIAIIPPLSGG